MTTAYLATDDPIIQGYEGFGERNLRDSAYEHEIDGGVIQRREIDFGIESSYYRSRYGNA